MLNVNPSQAERISPLTEGLIVVAPAAAVSRFGAAAARDCGYRNEFEVGRSPLDKVENPDNGSKLLFSAAEKAPHIRL